MILQSPAGLPAFLVYFIVKSPVPNLSKRIAAGEMASAIWLGLSSLAAGALNAAAMIT
jgi:putative membrane protein